MVGTTISSTTSTQIMIIQRGGSGAAFPSKSMELQWIRSNSRRKNSNLSSREFGGLKSIPPPLVMPIYISTDPSHVNIQELSELYTCCNHSCHRFPKVDPHTGIVQEVMDLDKLHIALSHSCVVVSVFCKPQHAKVTNITKQNQSQEQQEQIKTGLVGDLMENVMPVNPSNGQLVGFGHAVSDLGLTASIYDVMPTSLACIFEAMLGYSFCDLSQSHNLKLLEYQSQLLSVYFLRLFLLYKAWELGQ
ncbi:hypothetical protein ES332_D05G308400v1 [Gossypium tomentosum]|uniref:Uncharacterized protein n=1 Tax=Gossypium tomentosum TaxID=34277 RepID=A0A5D2L1Q2_GOSTO|nr:hypothetical protein ES332_D05G308400v1 [Gossypium tomentosum]